MNEYNRSRENYFSKDSKVHVAIKKMEDAGIDAATSRMQNARSTI